MFANLFNLFKINRRQLSTSAKQFFDLSTINRMMYDVTKKKKNRKGRISLKIIWYNLFFIRHTSVLKNIIDSNLIFCKMYKFTIIILFS